MILYASTIEADTLSYVNKRMFTQLLTLITYSKLLIKKNILKKNKIDSEFKTLLPVNFPLKC